MEVTPQIFTAKVMHKRLFPKVNAFTYGIYYLVLPLSNIAGVVHNRFGVLSFYDKDHGPRDGSDLESWIRPVLKQYKLDIITDQVLLVSMPRVLGYVFNPVSFWFCLDKDGGLRAVLCEVNNTFGQTHSYLCAHEEGQVIKAEDCLQAKKLFHVSPFLQRQGHYTFRFSIQEKQLGVWIDFYDDEGKKQLITSLIGELSPLTKRRLLQTFWSHPLVTFKTIWLIHWQALKLVLKGIKYISKPVQLKQKLSRSCNIKKI
jgi:DUF1365 family protein